jgi:HAD superfamily hydrolase (TIGR01509 family)
MSLPAGILFDMDDTLAATASLWRAADEYLLAALGHAWSKELAAQYKGMNALDVAATIHRVLRPALPVGECQRLMREQLLNNFQSRPAVAQPGAVELVRRMATLAPLAVASGSPMEAIELTLRGLGIETAFQVVLSSESVKRGKPHPDVFMAAAERLGVAAQDCLVFEDSLVGVQAARAAGMRVFVVPSEPAAAPSGLATRVFGSWKQVGVQDVAEAFGSR